MLLMTLDLGVITGYALGVAAPGAIPASGSKILRTRSEAPYVGLATLADWLNKSFQDKRKPNLLVKEKPLTLLGFVKSKNSAVTINNQIKMHGVVEAVCGLFGIPFIDAARATVLKHFVGNGKLSREDGKLAVLKQCGLIGYIPKFSEDEDQADACALWDYAAHKYGRMTQTELRLFGEDGA